MAVFSNGELFCSLSLLSFSWSAQTKTPKLSPHVVYPTKTIEVLDALNKASKPDDLWSHGGIMARVVGIMEDFEVLLPAHQTYDNYLTSEILRSKSPLKAAKLQVKDRNLCECPKANRKGENEYTTAVRAIFKDGKSDSAFYQGMLDDLGKGYIQCQQRPEICFFSSL